MLLLLFIALGSAAIVSEYISSPPGPPLRFEVREVQGTDRSSAEDSGRKEWRYSIILHNMKGCEIRVVGANTSCGIRGCIEVTPLPLIIPPYEDSELMVTRTVPKNVQRSDILKNTVQDFVLELYVDSQTGNTLTIPVTLTHLVAQ